MSEYSINCAHEKIVGIRTLLRAAPPQLKIGLDKSSMFNETKNQLTKKRGSTLSMLPTT